MANSKANIDKFVEGTAALAKRYFLRQGGTFFAGGSNDKLLEHMVATYTNRAIEQMNITVNEVQAEFDEAKAKYEAYAGLS